MQKRNKQKKRTAAFCSVIFKACRTRQENSRNREEKSPVNRFALLLSCSRHCVLHCSWAFLSTATTRYCNGVEHIPVVIFVSSSVGPYREKLCPRSSVHGQGPCLGSRAQFFPIRTDLGHWITCLFFPTFLKTKGNDIVWELVCKQRFYARYHSD